MSNSNDSRPRRTGEENFFLFGLHAAEAADAGSRGYVPRSWYEGNPHFREAMDQIAEGTFSRGDPNLFRPLVDNLLSRDEYLLLADYHSYIECQDRVSAAYRNSKKWAEMSILNLAGMGKFSSDRAIREYCEQIWKTTGIIDPEKYVYSGGKGRSCKRK